MSKKSFAPLALSLVDHDYDSATTTEPNTPLGFGHEINDPLEFARLIPHNRAAMIAFNELVQRAASIPTWQPHSRRFIIVHPGLRPLEDILGSASETDMKCPPTRNIYTGHYRLSLEMLPGNLNLGWVLGRGREEELVDILLCEESVYGVAGRHCRLVHNEYGVLMLQSDSRKRPVQIEGRIKVSDAGMALTSQETAIKVGKLDYILRFTITSDFESVYKIKLASLRGKHGMVGKLLPNLSITPSENLNIISGFSMQNIFDKGSSCHVLYALEISTGQFFAAKEIRYAEKSRGAVDHEVKVMTTIGRHRRIIELYKVVRPGSEMIPSTAPRIRHVFLIYSPLCYSTMADLVASDLGGIDRLRLLQQSIEGLQFIHGQGFMHRDVKLQNIGIRWDGRPHAVFLDFGVATMETTSVDHMVGTIRYLAPEIIDLKHHGSTLPYNKTADIWSLGLTMFELLCHQIWRMYAIDFKIYQNLREMGSKIQGVEKHGMKIVAKMMEWEPRSRPKLAMLMEELTEYADRNPVATGDKRPVEAKS